MSAEAQSLPAGGEAGGPARAGRFLALAFQLGLVLLAVHLFRLAENQGLFVLLPPIFAGFAIHYWLPARYRLPFFFLLSVVCLGLLFGPKGALFLVGTGLGLIGIAHLPMPYAARVVALLVAGGVLAAFRAELFGTHPFVPLLPILGSLFMFRLILYMYELRHEEGPPSVWHRLSYFFLLPNPCFPLFPVVDYQSFLTSYYDREADDIYQKGLWWMLRGVTHLILYRLIYYHVIPAPASVNDLDSLVLFMLASYALYLRISGQFHLIVGILGLFGFDLPETNRKYFLASGFSDLWRRMNVYWRDFMMRVVFYPCLYRMKPGSRAIVVSTLLVFLATWLLHSYQWFWLQGRFTLNPVDGFYWGTFALLVAANSVLQAGRRRRKRLGSKGWSLHGALRHALKVLATFSVLCFMWSFWTSSSIADWISLLSVAGNSTPTDWLLLLLAVAGAVAFGVVFQYLKSRGWVPAVADPPTFRRSAVLTAAIAGVVVLLGVPRVTALLGPRVGGIVASTTQEGFNQGDAELFERGYYESILGVENPTSPLWTAQVQKPRNWGTPVPQAFRDTGDLRRRELIPGTVGTMKRAPMEINSLGMRDREYARVKPPGTYRIVLLGASYAMGAGVANDETFEAVLEQRLNREKPLPGFERYEILNTAVDGYTVIQHVALVAGDLLALDPDAVFFLGHTRAERKALISFMTLLHSGTELRFDGLRRIRAEAEIEPGMSRTEVERRLQPLALEFVRWGYGEIAGRALEQGAAPVWIYLPRTFALDDQMTDVSADELAAIAEEQGFHLVSLAGVFGGHDPESIRLAPWDTHPNVLGHRLIADRLYEELVVNLHILAPPRGSE